MAIELLGPSLQDLLEFCGGKFSLKTTLLLADQMVNKNILALVREDRKAAFNQFHS